MAIKLINSTIRIWYSYIKFVFLIHQAHEIMDIVFKLDLEKMDDISRLSVCTLLVMFVNRIFFLKCKLINRDGYDLMAFNGPLLPRFR